MPRTLARATLMAVAFIGLVGGNAFAQAGAEQPGNSPPFENGARTGQMTGQRLLDFIAAIDPEAVIQGTRADFTFGERDVLLVFDEVNGRMRLMTPVAPIDALGERIMRRMLQANFDSVLDVRYAFAGDLAWATFIHPLPSLTEEDFRSGLVQTVVAAETFGTTFTSGTVVFGGGDSSELHKELLDSLDPGRGI